jgi:hypothetical protein
MGPTKQAFYEADENSPFYLRRKLPEEDVPEAIMDYMLSEDNIRDVIRSRDDLSACGNDGINYQIMKAAGQEGVKFMRAIIKATIKCRRVIGSWKEARTVLIYKKGERTDPKNWRPITITNCIYRIYTCLMARSFQQINLQHGIFIDVQKGFIKKTNGCSEHGIILNELFQNAKRTHKDLIVTSIDFEKAFGSVPHALIMSVLKQMNFPEWVRAIIEDMYDDAKSTIEYQGRQTSPFVWRKGVKQGCPLSPLLFNLCLEPLLEAIKRSENIHGLYVNTPEGVAKFTVQAYADDVVFISDDPRGIDQMLRVLDDFTAWSRMEVNVKKCATASYVYDDDKWRTFLDGCFKFRGQEIPNLTTADSMRYLGAPIAARRTVRLKSAKFKLKEMEILLGKIMSSALLTVQKIDAIKTFLLPSMDFLLLNGEAGGRDLEVMDKKIRGMVNRDLNIKGLPIECHHASWRDGGLSYPSLRDRGDVLIIRSFAQITLSEDDLIQSMMRKFIEDERRFRGIQSDPDAPFLDWGEDGSTRSGTSTIIARTRGACKRLDVKLKLKDRSLIIKAEESEMKTNSAVGIGRFLTQKVIRPQKIKSLLEKEKHGATFETLKDNQMSNKILTDAKTMKSDAFFRFRVAARADILPTPANIQQWYNQPRTGCARCEAESKPTLAHILNSCRVNLTDMTRRHNKVMDVVRRAIQDVMGERVLSNIGENIAIREERLTEEVRSLRPDMSFIAETFSLTFTVLIDISCPYGRIAYRKNTLEKVYVDKMEKYRRLADEIRAIRRMPVEIIPIIVSSLGAVHKRSIEALESLLRCDDKKLKKIARRLSEAALAGSLEIWRKYAKEMPHEEDRRIEQVTVREVTIAKAGDKEKQAKDEERDKSESEGQPSTNGEEREYDLTDELEIEEIGNEEADDEHTDDEEEDETAAREMEECTSVLSDTDFM